MGQQIRIDGVYRGKDLYIQNPYTNVEGSFCIAFIKVNDKRLVEEPKSSAIRLNLSRFSINDSLHIIIKHHSVCQPKVLNPEVLNAGNEFEYLQITADDAAISWVTTGELPGKGWYELFKMKLDGWVPEDSVLGKGNLDNNQYSVGVRHYAGENRFKLVYHYGAEQVASDEFTFYSDQDPISYFPEGNVYDLITLSRPTDWVIKDYTGKIWLKGDGQDIVISNLPYGELILVIENMEETIFRPEPEIIDRPKKKSRKKGRN